MIAVWLAAMACVGAMGFAIQRGGTCTVAAVAEMIDDRRSHRLRAMLEASLWVAGGLALAHLGHLAGSMPSGYAASAWTVIGGVLLGVGAWVNGACVFGSVARLGSGEWTYAATPMGFFVGCLSVMVLFPRPPALAIEQPSLLFELPGFFAVAFLLFALWRIGFGILALRRPGDRVRLGEAIWAPHVATVVIGVTFVLTLLLAGRWAYTDVLADLAHAMHGMRNPLALPILLLLALYAGALIGGRSADRWRSTSISISQVLRCVAGGVLMGWGSLLVPGSNDGLILIGIPLLRPYAWLAFASMFCAIGAALSLQRAWSTRAGAIPAPPQQR